VTSPSKAPDAAAETDLAADDVANEGMRLAGISKMLGGRIIVEDLDLDVHKGELVCLLGPSGCGKTTTLRMIGGFLEPDTGRLTINGVDHTYSRPERRPTAMVFQNYALWPHMSVTKNIAFGLRVRKLSNAKIAEKVDWALDLLGLQHHKDSMPARISGGEQQRVALARALVLEPEVLLMDEPLSNLDAKLRDTMRDEIRSIQQKVAITTVFVTHDQDEALATSDRIVVMSVGNIEQVGTPESIYEHPANQFVANFIGRANIFDGQITDTAQGVATVDIKGLGAMTAIDDHRRLGSGTLMVRPHRMTLAPCSPDRAHGQVSSMIYVGDSVEYSVNVAGRPVLVQSVSTGDPHLLPGTPVRLSWHTSDAVVLKDEVKV